MKAKPFNSETRVRCPWVSDDPLYQFYHDQEWGVPVRDDQSLFAKLILDGAQAGLSWITILRKRENYYQAFDQFDPEKMAGYDEKKIRSLLQNSGIIRNRLKIQAAVGNARAYLELQSRGSGFSEFLWRFVGGNPIQNRWRTIDQLPARSAQSEAMSRALHQCGFRFVGPTICYAFMQAVGMVNDHLVSCFRYRQVAALSDGTAGSRSKSAPS